MRVALTAKTEFLDLFQEHEAAREAVSAQHCMILAEKLVDEELMSEYVLTELMILRKPLTDRLSPAPPIIGNLSVDLREW